MSSFLCPFSPLLFNQLTIPGQPLRPSFHAEPSGSLPLVNNIKPLLDVHPALHAAVFLDTNFLVSRIRIICFWQFILILIPAGVLAQYFKEGAEIWSRNHASRTPLPPTSSKYFHLPSQHLDEGPANNGSLFLYGLPAYNVLFCFYILNN